MQAQSLQSFLDVLAADAATPGGGGVAAVNGAMAAALVSMVCRLTIGRKKYADVETEMQEILPQAEACRAKLTALLAEDVAAFDAVMEAFRLPKTTEAEKSTRRNTIQIALKEATRVPLETAKLWGTVLTLAKIVAQKGNTNAASDAGSAAQSALAGLKSAALNVYINLGSIRDEAFIAETSAQMDTLLSTAPALARPRLSSPLAASNAAR